VNTKKRKKERMDPLQEYLRHTVFHSKDGSPYLARSYSDYGIPGFNPRIYNGLQVLKSYQDRPVPDEVIQQLSDLPEEALFCKCLQKDPTAIHQYQTLSTTTHQLFTRF
jgi:hypothetical protein